MKLTVHSLGIPVTLDTNTVQAYLWSGDLNRVVLVLSQDGLTSKLPLDEPLWQIEQKFEALQ